MWTVELLLWCLFSIIIAFFAIASLFIRSEFEEESAKINSEIDNDEEFTTIECICGGSSRFRVDLHGVSAYCDNICCVARTPDCYDKYQARESWNAMQEGARNGVRRRDAE